MKKVALEGLYVGGLLERMGLIGKNKVATFDVSDRKFVEKEERFKRLASMVRKSKYRGKVQENLALKTVRAETQMCTAGDCNL